MRGQVAVAAPDAISGYATVHETVRREGGAFVLGGFVRFYDAHGNLLRETPPADYVQLAA